MLLVLDAASAIEPIAGSGAIAPLEFNRMVIDLSEAGTTLTLISGLA
jgi:hypothetical protein